jgi:hypothetical protein
MKVAVLTAIYLRHRSIENATQLKK